MTILEEAAEHVEGRRQQDYGPPAENFYRVAQLWTAYLAGRGLIDLDRTDGIMPTDYAWMMALVKIARLEHGYHHDSVVDLAGYAACAAQINEVDIRPSVKPLVSNADWADYDEDHPCEHQDSKQIDSTADYRWCVDCQEAFRTYDDDEPEPYMAYAEQELDEVGNDPEPIRRCSYYTLGEGHCGLNAHHLGSHYLWPNHG